MKSKFYLILALLSFSFLSCSKCKTCKHPVTPTSQEKVCEGNLSAQEYNDLIEQKEAMGYVCN